MSNKNLAIIIPTYNEKENIFNLISEIGSTIRNQSIDTLIIVIDDNSPDGTADLLLRNRPILEEKYSTVKIQLIKREEKLGLGSAYLRGFNEALTLKVDYIMEMDADFSHQPKYIPLFIEAIQDADVVIGSRYVRGGGTENWGKIRKVLSKGAGLYARTILGMKVQDMTAGFVMYKSQILQDLNLNEVKSNGYSFQIEMKYRIWKKGYRIKEIPIVFPDRILGKSKISKISTIVNTMKIVWQLKLDNKIRFKKISQSKS